MADMDLPSSSSDYDDDSDTSEQEHSTSSRRPAHGLATDTAASTGNADSGDMLKDDAADVLHQRPEAQLPASPIISILGSDAQAQNCSARTHQAADTDQSWSRDAFESQMQKMQLREESRIPGKAS